MIYVSYVNWHVEINLHPPSPRQAGFHFKTLGVKDLCAPHCALSTLTVSPSRAKATARLTMATQNTFKADWIPSQNDASQTQTSSKRKSTASWQQLGRFLLPSHPTNETRADALAGLSPQMTRALGLRGFKQPTPIQRMAIPSALENPPRDILGMARTGSGKTLAYLIPMLQRLGTRREPHGIRCLILCPSRELAVQILKAGKDLSRSLAGTDKSSALRWSVIMGGESLDQQFEKISEKPDM